METVTFNELPALVGRLCSQVDRIESLLINKSGPEPDKFMTLREVAEYLHLSYASIYRLTSNRQIPFSKQGKKLYFLKSEVDEWLKSGRRATVAELKETL